MALTPPGANFELVYAERDAWRKNWVGPDAPLATHITDVPSDRFEMYDLPEGKTVCRLDKPAMACGLRVDDEEIGWTVLLELRNVELSSSIRAEALAKLREYRQ